MRDPAEPGVVRHVGRTVVVGLSVAPVFLVTVLAGLITAYDRLSYSATHAAVIRSLLPWRPWSLIAPALPLYALTAPHWQEAAPLGRQAAFVVAWLVGGVVLAEVYSVCLHREAWIASFEPRWIPLEATPLGGPPPTADDRRLHHLIRTQAIYAVAPVAVAALLTTDSSIPSLLISMAFIAKLVGHASSDYEVCFHWHMHCHVLTIQGRPWLSAAWDGLCEYILGPLWGYLPRVYRAEHLLIHHPENSGPEDSSSLLPFSKTSFLEFCIFAQQRAWSHLLASDIARHRRCRGQGRRRLVLAVCAYWLVVGALLYAGVLLGVWLLCLALHRAVAASRAQYIWHGLVDPACPRDPIASTILWMPGAEAWNARLARAGQVVEVDGARPARPGGLATPPPPDPAPVPDPGTDWAYYDNYHLLHHRYPRAHYSEYPWLLDALVPQVVRSRAVVMDMRGMDDFAFRCWSGDIDHIAELVLSEPGDGSKEEFVAARLAGVERYRSPYARVCSSRFAMRADRALVATLRVITRGR
jgi:hypothetical protein